VKLYVMLRFSLSFIILYESKAAVSLARTTPLPLGSLQPNLVLSRSLHKTQSCPAIPLIACFTGIRSHRRLFDIFRCSLLSPPVLKDEQIRVDHLTLFPRSTFCDYRSERESFAFLTTDKTIQAE
jgi:hypothetical protein